MFDIQLFTFLLLQRVITLHYEMRKVLYWCVTMLSPAKHHAPRLTDLFAVLRCNCYGSFYYNGKLHLLALKVFGKKYIIFFSCVKMKKICIQNEFWCIMRIADENACRKYFFDV